MRLKISDEDEVTVNGKVVQDKRKDDLYSSINLRELFVLLIN